MIWLQLGYSPTGETAMAVLRAECLPVGPGEYTAVAALARLAQRMLSLAFVRMLLSPFTTALTQLCSEPESTRLIVCAFCLRILTAPFTHVLQHLRAVLGVVRGIVCRNASSAPRVLPMEVLQRLYLTAVRARAFRYTTISPSVMPGNEPSWAPPRIAWSQGSFTSTGALNRVVHSHYYTCFKQAGWRLVRDAHGKPVRSGRGLLLLEHVTEEVEG